MNKNYHPAFDTVSVAIFSTLILVFGVFLSNRADTPWTFVAFYMVTLTVAVLYVKARAGLMPSISWKEMGVIRPNWESLAYGIAGGLLTYGIGLALLVLDYYPAQQHKIHGATDWLAIAPLLLGTLLQVTAEEILFRGYLFSRLNRQVGLPIAIAVSSILFGILHAPYVLGPTIYGLIFAWMFLRTKNILAPIIAHFLHNGTLTLLTLEFALR